MARWASSRPWPVNAWAGTTIENQEWADRRIPALLQVPAPVRFLSCEPLLGALTLDLTGIHWVIAGGESGPGARPSHPDWFRSLRDQCAAAGVPFHFKQWGEFAPVGDGRGVNVARVGKAAAGRLLDGIEHNDYPKVKP